MAPPPANLTHGGTVATTALPHHRTCPFRSTFEEYAGKNRFKYTPSTSFPPKYAASLPHPMMRRRIFLSGYHHLLEHTTPPDAWSILSSTFSLTGRAAFISAAHTNSPRIILRCSAICPFFTKVMGTNSSVGAPM